MRRMIRCLLLAPAAFLVVAPAHAQINMAWNNCITEANAAENVSYACDGSRNGFPFRAVLSFVSPADMPGFVGLNAWLQIYPSSYPTDPPGVVLPDFWRMAVGECREGNFAYMPGTVGLGTGYTGACQNPFHGDLSTTSKIFTEHMPPNMPWPGHVTIGVAGAQATGTTLVAGQQYMAGHFTIDTYSDIDMGTGICPGCSAPAYIVLSQVDVEQIYPDPSYSVTTPGTRNYVTWQSGPVPVRNRTWGAIKATYR